MEAVNLTKKDKEAQKRGRQSRKKGQEFEALISESFDFYKQVGTAMVEKTPEPMRVIKRLDGGKFIACFTKKAQPDYEGTLNGGRSVLFEAKYTDTDRLEQSRVLGTQAEYMTKKTELGARCFIIAGFSSGGIYLIPWQIWDHMKIHFGRKYVKEDDLRSFKVPVSRAGYLMLIH